VGPEADSDEPWKEESTSHQEFQMEVVVPLHYMHAAHVAPQNSVVPAAAGLRVQDFLVASSVRTYGLEVVVNTEGVEAILEHSASLVLDMPAVRMAPVVAAPHIVVVAETAGGIAVVLESLMLDRTLVVSRVAAAANR
jgi:hypothetical protein